MRVGHVCLPGTRGSPSEQRLICSRRTADDRMQTVGYVPGIRQLVLPPCPDFDQPRTRADSCRTVCPQAHALDPLKCSNAPVIVAQHRRLAAALDQVEHVMGCVEGGAQVSTSFIDETLREVKRLSELGQREE